MGGPTLGRLGGVGRIEGEADAEVATCVGCTLCIEKSRECQLERAGQGLGVVGELDRVEGHSTAPLPSRKLAPWVVCRQESVLRSRERAVFP